MSNRTPTQTALLVLGALIMLAGIVVLVMGFSSFASSDVATDDNTPLFEFLGGGFAMVVGFGIIAFTRASIITGNGGYVRVTYEQGRRPDDQP